MAYSKVCLITKCPEPTSARLVDSEEGKYRRDLCFKHTMIALRLYGRDKVEIVDTWNGTTQEDYNE